MLSTRSRIGGALAVRHRGQEVLFDWSSKKPGSIQWAAFFSDCEHEVLEAMEGHRITLTYNLYWTSYGPSLMAAHLGACTNHRFTSTRGLKSSLDALHSSLKVSFMLDKLNMMVTYNNIL
jgi:hypothetical protein